MDGRCRRPLGPRKSAEPEVGCRLGKGGPESGIEELHLVYRKMFFNVALG